MMRSPPSDVVWNSVKMTSGGADPAARCRAAEWRRASKAADLCALPVELRVSARGQTQSYQCPAERVEARVVTIIQSHDRVDEEVVVEDPRVWECVAGQQP
jgi:hypothetical protein